MLRRSTMLNAFAGLALCAAAGVVSAQDRVAAGADVEVRRISNIMKTKVIIQEDRPAGQIVDVVYNDGGCIDYFVAAHDDRQYVVPFDAVQYRAADRVVFVDIAPAQFERVHFFTANQWPDFYAPGFRDQVFASFNVRGGAAGGRSRTTLRQGTDVNIDARNRTDIDARSRTDVDARNRTDVDARNRTDVDARNRTDADRNRPEGADRDRNRPEASDRDRNRPEAADRDRPERNPSTTPESSDRPRTGTDSSTPPPPRPGTGNNPGREGAEPPKAGSDTNPGRGSNPPRSGSDTNPGRGSNPPRPGAGSGSSGSGTTPPATTPSAGSGDKKPLSPPPVVPK